MKIGDLFSKDIFRPINGVVMAEQQDDASISQELGEFVVTKELSRHFDQFFSVYLDALDNPRNANAAGKIGVWVSGFFGSGKSHFIKVLHYLFKNQTVKEDGTEKQAIEFFQDKVQDAIMFGNIKRAVSRDADVILFNIDSKADQSKGRDAILAVFLKVLNELQGYSPDHPHIAHMERYLDRQSKLDYFQEKYRALTSQDWKDDRREWHFNQDEIVKSLSQTLGQSEESCHRWIDHAESDFSLTIENFAKWTKEYLDTKSADHGIFFFVDEMGQFIGQDTHLMLNLQTLVENLGVVCNGKAWVVVTSQEDIDTVLGSVSHARSNDFSKIQGRFKTRLSLSSANTDEVIQRRLLLKKDQVKGDLERLYEPYADILKNQLTFPQDTGMTLSTYQSTDDFIRNYPFIPYQFKLLQKVFESIRRAGATGLHLAQGERSMLEAFQYAGQQVASKELGALVPLYWFYASIENFLDTSVKRTIEQAKENPSLHEFDVFVLQTLFMIRYITEIKGSLDNLVTLSIDGVDSDKFALRKKIEESLQRLEKETLINHSGENYFFLTSEEQLIEREIKNTELEYGSESVHLGKTIFDNTYGGNKKHRYSKTNKDFDLNILCDMRPVSRQLDNGLNVSIISPFFEDYSLYEQSRCIGESTNDKGQVLIRLPVNGKLAEEIRTYLQTEKYIRNRPDVSPEVQRILRDRSEDNRIRSERVKDFVEDMFGDSQYYINGQRHTPETDDPQKGLAKALDYLVDNTFPKMAYIEHPCTNPQKEIQSILMGDDMAQDLMNLQLAENNPRAISEVREYIGLCARQSSQMILGDMVEDRFGIRPFGWYEWETVLILVKLLIAGEIQLEFNSGIVDKRNVSELILKTSNWKKLKVRQRMIPDREKIEAARKIGQELFEQICPDKEDPLTAFLKDHFQKWRDKLNQYKTLADAGNYPGKSVIDEGLRLCGIMLEASDSFTFIHRVNESKDDLLHLGDKYHEVDTFYSTQRPLWDKLGKAKTRFDINRFELEKDDGAKAALVRMKEILEASEPYSIIREAGNLIETVEKVNNQLLIKAKEDLCQNVDELVDRFGKEAKCPEDIKASSIQELESYKGKASGEHSIANIHYLWGEAEKAFERLVNAIPLKKGEIKKEIVTVKPGSLPGKKLLETQKDIDDFLEGVKKALEGHISNGKTVRLV